MALIKLLGSFLFCQVSLRMAVFLKAICLIQLSLPLDSSNLAPFPQSLEIGLGHTFSFLLNQGSCRIYWDLLHTTQTFTISSFVNRQCTICFSLILKSKNQICILVLKTTLSIQEKMKTSPTSDLSLNSTRHKTMYFWLPNLNS